MRKIILSAIMLLGIGYTAQAQKATYGIKAGVNFATWGGDVDNTKSRTGFHAGFIAEFNAAPNFSIQPELLYSQQGVRFQDSGSVAGVPYNQEVKGKFDYLTLPVLFKFYVVEGFNIYAGPQVGYLLSAKTDSDASVGSFYGSSSSDDIRDDSNDLDFGLTGGIGYDSPTGLFLQARYYAGLSNVNKDGDADIKNNVFQLSIGYKFK